MGAVMCKAYGKGYKQAEFIITDVSEAVPRAVEKLGSYPLIIEIYNYPLHSRRVSPLTIYEYDEDTKTHKYTKEYFIIKYGDDYL